MLSREDQRRFDQITRQLRMSDPEFVARLGDTAATRRNRLAIVASLLLWASVPALTVIGGWAAGATSAALLGIAGVLALRARPW
ncbi:Protein of unknown function [Micromonospora pattaloongensis]|uniref:DUF3040 domain-containing protein n=1 Tax=Micromonospora pattaloongensis TaxID=405436 RepID=A0A1H3PT76_9ACTN|nr:DUF3040 domain-containing protein [Micromonospora pattaloongensis]SDZ04522.1 Protein of unknown function [Micromonospora pattaloongensis]